MSRGGAGTNLCLHTLYPDLGRGTDVHLTRTLAAARDAGFASLDLFASHVVQAIESAAAGGRRPELTPRADRRSAVPDYQAALLRAGAALASPPAVSIRELFVAHELTVEVVEATSTWPAGPLAGVEAEVRALCSVANFLRARFVVAVCLDEVVDGSAAADGLQMVADVAAEHGLGVCLEWLPFSGVASMRAARELIERSGATNVAFTLDALHWQCQPGGPDWPLLDELDPAAVAFVQLSDCRLPLAPGVVEPLSRLAPGEGDIDLERLLAALQDRAMTPIMSVEVFDEDRLMHDGVAAFAQAQGESLATVLAAAAGRPG